MRTPIPTTRCPPDERGQMAVELAVLVPVIIVVALTTANLAHYIELCAQFDRTALDMVIAQGVAVDGESSQASAVTAVEEAIRSAMDDGGRLGEVEVRVSAAVARGRQTTGAGVTFPVSPLLTSFTCTLTYHPWPASFTMAGISYRSPLALTHKRSITVDRFRPGVVA